MPEPDINMLAVVVAALSTFAIGALWYSPLLFGKLWIKAHEYSDDDVKEMQKTAGKAYVVSFFCYIVMAAVLAVLISYTGVSTVLQGAGLGFLVWLGFLATLGLTANMFSDKPLSTYLIDVGYQLVYAVTMGIILAAWR